MKNDDKEKLGKIFSLTSEADAAFIKTVRNNRDLSSPASIRRIRDIKNDILAGKAKYMSAIELSLDNYLLDGQHRLEAMRQAWREGSTQTLEYRYMNVPLNELAQAVIDKNKNLKQWANKDYFNSLVKENNPDAIMFKQFALRHDLLHTKKGEIKMHNTAAILMGTPRAFDEQLKTQTLTITKEMIEWGDYLYYEIEKLAKCFKFCKDTWFESMIIAWFRIRDNEKLSQMIDDIRFDNFAKMFKKKAHFEPQPRYQPWYDSFELAIRKLHDELIAA